ncbi:MAG: hypothetical protein MUO77_12105, partial [Anaerolineales bacterium]|nr:hypothetical protein [Anaerolineales bacterium]
MANGQTNYFHSVLTPVIVQAGNQHVISLEPEFITPQDGHEKQDCEITAGKRWLSVYGKYYARWNVTILGDDLFSRQPFCQAMKENHLHYILVCKPDSHSYLYDSVAFLAAQGTLGLYQKRIWNGKHGEIYAILKTKGYHHEHNFGHGCQQLSSVLLSLNLLAFLFHTVMGLVDEKYRLLRQVLRKR